LWALFRYYKGYLDFFREEIEVKSVPAILEEYIFSLAANHHESNSGKKGMEMISRLYDGLMHGLIHLGVGLEFGQPSLLAEG
jgi:oxidoreductase AflY